MEFCIAADVLDGYRHFDKILNLAYLFGGNARSFEGVGHGKQIMGIATIHTTPAKVVSEPGSIGPAHELFQTPKVFAVEPAQLIRSTWRRHSALPDIDRESDRGCKAACRLRPCSFQR